jgi:hypothetical protein
MDNKNWKWKPDTYASCGPNQTFSHSTVAKTIGKGVYWRVHSGTEEPRWPNVSLETAHQLGDDLQVAAPQGPRRARCSHWVLQRASDKPVHHPLGNASLYLLMELCQGQSYDYTNK